MGHVRNWIAIALGLMLASLGAAAASFDCSQRLTPIESLICSDTEFSKLDDALAEVFRTAREKASNTAQVVREQRNWIAERNKCTERECVRILYRARLSELAAAVGEGVQKFKAFQAPHTGVEARMTALLEAKMPKTSPSLYARVGRDSYLVIVQADAAIAIGVYFMNLRERRIDRLTGGEQGFNDPDAMIRHMPDGTKWVLYVGSVLSRGIGSKMYRAIVLKPTTNGEVVPVVSNLADVVWEGHEDHCNAKQPWATTSVTSMEVRDVDGDGMDDVVLDMEETNCASHETRRSNVVHLFRRDQFVKRAL